MASWARHDKMPGMNTDERDSRYFALLDAIKLQKGLIFRMRENGAMAVGAIDDWSEHDIAAAQLEHSIEVEERILADLERQMRLL